MSEADTEALLTVLREHVGKPVLAFGDAPTAAVLGGLRELGEPPSRCYGFYLTGGWYGLARARAMARVVGSPFTAVAVHPDRAIEDVRRVVELVGVNRARRDIQLAHLLVYLAPRAARDGHDRLISPSGDATVLDHVGFAMGAEVAVPWAESPLREAAADPAELARALKMPGPYAAEPTASSGLRALHQALLGSEHNPGARSLDSFYRQLVGEPTPAGVRV